MIEDRIVPGVAAGREFYGHAHPLRDLAAGRRVRGSTSVPSTRSMALKVPVRQRPERRTQGFVGVVDLHRGSVRFGVALVSRRRRVEGEKVITIPAGLPTRTYCRPR